MDVLGTLRRYGIRPSKGLGQNLLVDEAILDAIVQGSGVGSEDLVLEIGPGLGTLTRRLASKANQVVAVELDRRMVSILESELAETDNVRIVQGDILELAPSELLAEELATHSGYSVVANLPYYITSAALRHLLTGRRPERMTVMVQREVAERIMAQPGKLSLLALSVQVFGAPQLVCRVPSSAFFPEPKVSSAVIRVDMYDEPLVPEALQEAFFGVARAGFSQKRKQLHNSLRSGLRVSSEAVRAALEQAGVDATRRAQTLSIEEWVRLAEGLGRAAYCAGRMQ